MRPFSSIVIIQAGLIFLTAADTSVSSGEGVLLELHKDKSYTVVGRLNFAQ